MILTRRLLLRRITDDDLPNIYRGLSHPDVVRYYGVSFTSEEETKEQMVWYAELEKTGTGLWWALCSQDHEVFYGAAGFNNVSVEHRKGEIGFWLLPEFWGKGLIREALPAVLRYGFGEMDLHRIEGVVESGNETSRRALLQVGFVHEGTARDAEWKNGTPISLETYALLRHEFHP